MKIHTHVTTRPCSLPICHCTVSSQRCPGGFVAFISEFLFSPDIYQPNATPYSSPFRASLRRRSYRSLTCILNLHMYYVTIWREGGNGDITPIFTPGAIVSCANKNSRARKPFPPSIEAPYFVSKLARPPVHAPCYQRSR